MSKTRLKIIIALAVCTMACLVTAGCSIGLSDLDDYRDYYDVTAQVTYYGNGGYFDSNYIVSRTLEYTTGTTFYDIQKYTTGSSDDDTTSSNTMVRRSNYDLLGWYEVDQRIVVTVTEDKHGDEVIEETIYFVLDLDDDGMAATYDKTDANTYSYTYSSTTFTFVRDNFIDSDGAWLMLQEDYDSLVSMQAGAQDSTVEVPLLKDNGLLFTSDMIMEDDTWTYVVAKWRESACIRYYLAVQHGVDGFEADGITVSTTTSGETSETAYEEGDLIYSEYYLSSTIQRSDSDSIIAGSSSVKDATLLGYYFDADCTQPVSGQIFYRPSTGASDDEYYITIYALYLPGTWTLIRSAANVRTMFNAGNANYYLMNDIDCSTLSYDLSPMTTFSGRIEGNGYTISNMSFSKSRINAETAIFGTLSGNAVINDLSLENVSVSYTVTGSYVYLFMLFNSVNASNGTPQISGLNVTGYTLSITTSSADAIIGNIQEVNGVYAADNILYGITPEYGETDAQFEALYGAATVSGYTIVLNGVTVITSE